MNLGSSCKETWKGAGSSMRVAGSTNVSGQSRRRVLPPSWAPTDTKKGEFEGQDRRLVVGDAMFVSDW